MLQGFHNFDVDFIVVLGRIIQLIQEFIDLKFVVVCILVNRAAGFAMAVMMYDGICRRFGGQNLCNIVLLLFALSVQAIHDKKVHVWLSGLRVEVV